MRESNIAELKERTMKRSKRLLAFVLMLVMALSVALSGCSGDKKGDSSDQSDASSKEPTYGGSVVVGIQQDIDSLDPHKATAAGTKEILFNIFEGLVKPDENGNLIKAVASDYKVSDDGLVYTFTIRDGIKFHNGNAVTAEDVKYSLDRASGLLDGNALITALKKISAVNIVDDRTVEVTLASADTEMIYNFTAAIIPKPADGTQADAGKPVGTGPFKFVSYTPQESIILTKNEDYWQNGLPYLDEVKFKIVSGTDTALLELKGGSIDMYPYLTDSQAEELKSTYDIEYAISDVAQALFLNNAEAPFDNEKVRQAVACALNKDEINQFVAGGKSAVINSAMLPTIKNYYVDTNSYNSYNVSRAKQLLAEAGYPNGFDMTIKVPSNYTFHMETAQVVAEQLKAAGINAKIEGIEWSSWLSDVYANRDYQATICALTADLTPSSLLVRFTSGYSKNFVNFSDAEYDKVYAEAQASLDDNVRKEKYAKLQQIFAEKEGSVFIQAAALLVAKNKDLAGYKFYPVYVQDMSTVYYIKK